MKSYIYLFGLASLFSNLLSAQIVVQTTGTNVSCFGGANGTALATASGGNLPYTFHWSNGGSNNTIADLPMGTYTVSVTDNTGSTGTKSITITQPPLLGATLNGQPQICVVAPDGFTYAIPTGGTPPYTYQWSNGIQTQLNNYLTADNYAVTVTDTRGCTAVKSFAVGFLGSGLFLLPHADPASCPHPEDGTASITALSGNGPYTYQWSNGATTSAIGNVPAGIYQVLVSDVNGCSATNSITVEQENVEPATIDVADPQCTFEVYDFHSTDGYHVYQWAVSDPRDSIIGRNDTRDVQVKWGVQGQKELTVVMNDTLTGCSTGMSFGVTVYVCASSTQNAALERLQVTPNPFDHYVSINGNGQQFSDAAVLLYNLQGVLVQQQTFGGEATTINTAGLAPGVYFLKVVDPHASKTWKLVKP